MGWRGCGASLGRHLAALLEEKLPQVALDGPLVATARGVIGRVPLASRAYSRLKPLASGKAAVWRPSEALGPAGVQLFVRLSGRGLEEGIDGLYTVAGFRDGVLPGLAQAAREAASEGWVMGSAEGERGDAAGLEAGIVELYAAEYAAAWEAMFADLNPAPLRNLMQASQDLFLLASTHSPIRAVLASAAKELAVGGVAPEGAVRAAMAGVDQRFAPVRALFGSGGAAPIDLVLRPLGNLQQQLARQASTASKAAPLGVGEDPANALRVEAARQPQPLARWLVSLATSGAALRDGGPRGLMIAAWNASGGPAALCPAVIGNKYPFVPGAAADASLEEFTRLLGPGGAIDGFFNTQLKPYVDQSGKGWKLQAVDGVSAPLTAADLAQFERAAAIRELYFPGGERAAAGEVRCDAGAAGGGGCGGDVAVGGHSGGWGEGCGAAGCGDVAGSSAGGAGAG